MSHWRFDSPGLRFAGPPFLRLRRKEGKKKSLCSFVFAPLSIPLSKCLFINISIQNSPNKGTITNKAVFLKNFFYMPQLSFTKQACLRFEM
jgi:hypothetical protein